MVGEAEQKYIHCLKEVHPEEPTRAVDVLKGSLERPK